MWPCASKLIMETVSAAMLVNALTTPAAALMMLESASGMRISCAMVGEGGTDGGNAQVGFQRDFL